MIVISAPRVNFYPESTPAPINTCMCPTPTPTSEYTKDVFNVDEHVLEE